MTPNLFMKLTIRLRIAISKILENIGRREIGRQSDVSEDEPFSKRGKIFAASREHFKLIIIIVNNKLQ